MEHAANFFSERHQAGPVVRAGHATHLGATPDRNGVNFAISAPDADKVELCLFDAQGNETRLALPQKNAAGVWHGHVAGLKEGQQYGYRIWGEYAPEKGRRFNGNKLLVDPYARAIDGTVQWTGAEKVHWASNDKDNAAHMPKCRVVDWQKLAAKQSDVAAKPTKELADYIICEAHVKGATMQNEAIPEKLRGTYAGMASDEMIGWLKTQGYNAVELLPIHTFPDDSMLVEKGLKNYWGYMTLGYLAPQAAYAATDKPEEEFAAMVRKLKDNGIDVIMDVVYNHTCEGNHEGPNLSIRGIDNHMYRLTEDKTHYFDTTGCGNSLDFNHPSSRKLVIDSLRHFADLGVAGFRFDLGVALGREGWKGDFNPDAKLFQDINNDPVLKKRHMIWEPWDLGNGGYQVGNMPRDASWSDKYRESMKEFCMSEHGTSIEDLALYLAGSSHVFQTPTQSVNYITSHDGSTLRDLVTYADKHNLANGEQNRDGHGGYRNLGHEGETDDPAINSQRARLQRFALATLALSQGPMMVPLGHESGKTQGGNTNVYCQDNPTSWIPWGDQLDAQSKDMQEFSKQMFQFRHKHPALRRLSHFDGKVNPETGMKDVTWLHPQGREIQQGDWKSGLKSMGVLVSGDNDRGQKDDPVLMLFNGSNTDTTFTLPELPPGFRWHEAIDSSGEAKGHRRRTETPKAGDHIRVPSRSVLIYEAAPIGKGSGSPQGYSR
jgi:isoamylase